MTIILNLILPLANLYMLWRISRDTASMADESERRRELNDSIKKFGAVFAEAAEVPKPPKKLKIQTDVE